FCRSELANRQSIREAEGLSRKRVLAMCRRRSAFTKRIFQELRHGLQDFPRQLIIRYRASHAERNSPRSPALLRRPYHFRSLREAQLRVTQCSLEFVGSPKREF